MSSTYLPNNSVFNYSNFLVMLGIKLGSGQARAVRKLFKKAQRQCEGTRVIQWLNVSKLLDPSHPCLMSEPEAMVYLHLPAVARRDH